MRGEDIRFSQKNRTHPTRQQRNHLWRSRLHHSKWDEKRGRMRNDCACCLPIESDRGGLSEEELSKRNASQVTAVRVALLTVIYNLRHQTWTHSTHLETHLERLSLQLYQVLYKVILITLEYATVTSGPEIFYHNRLHVPGLINECRPHKNLRSYRSVILLLQHPSLTFMQFLSPLGQVKTLSWCRDDHRSPCGETQPPGILWRTPWQECINSAAATVDNGSTRSLINIGARCRCRDEISYMRWMAQLIFRGSIVWTKVHLNSP